MKTGIECMRQVLDGTIIDTGTFLGFSVEPYQARDVQNGLRLVAAHVVTLTGRVDRHEKAAHDIRGVLVATHPRFFGQQLQAQGSSDSNPFYHSPCPVQVQDMAAA